MACARNAWFCALSALCKQKSDYLISPSHSPAPGAVMEGSVGSLDRWGTLRYRGSKGFPPQDPSGLVTRSRPDKASRFFSFLRPRPH